MAFGNDAADDEALARALQEEYEAEYRRSRIASASAPPSSSPPRQSAQPQSSSSPFSSALSPSPTARITSSNNGNQLSDAELARRIAAEEASYSGFSGGPPQTGSGREPFRKRSDTTATSVSSSSSGGDVAASDAELARRIEQELRDEEIARQIAGQEEARISRQQAQHMARRTHASQQGCTCQRFCGYLIPIAVILASAAALVWYFVYQDNDIPDWVPDPEDFFNEDPFNALDPEDANKWHTSGLNGLTLEVINALEDKWQDTFYTSVAEWDAGDPDALTLTTSRGDPDYDCEAIQGKLKVCNGDYGDTLWRGINQVLLTDGYIIASSAKMNEYYIRGSNEDQMMYTMCHEIGHGFGLPHTDENFYNKDLGNCMDYTNNPGNNKQPTEDNFNFLAELYGTVPGSPGSAVDGGNGTAAVSSVAAAGGNRGRRSLRRIEGELNGDSNAMLQVPDSVMSAWKELIPSIEQRRDGTELEGGWRLLHRNLHGEAHEIDLGQGYILRVHKLLVPPTDGTD